MTVYTDVRFLDAAVDSVLGQDFKDLELVIVDDGTGFTDLFEALCRRDARIRVVRSPRNIGTAAAANLGIAAARAEIIARLDADDIAEPGRIATQVAALEADPDLGFVGSAVTLIDETGAICGTQSMPVSDLEVRWTLLFHNPFYHSAVVFRRRVFEAAGHYRPDELVSQDHYLWFDGLPHCRARNLPQPLVRYRQNMAGLTVTHSTGNPRARTHSIREAAWRAIGLTYDLYDNARAGAISRFLRGHDIALDERFDAYCVILRTLKAFLKAQKPLKRPEDADDGRRLVASLLRRIMASPAPADQQDTLRRLMWRTWPWQAFQARVMRRST